MPEARTPEWVGDYVGLDFAEHGRTREAGLDCYGLIRLVFLERRRITLPSLASLYVDSDDASSIADLIRMQRSGPGLWKEIEPANVVEGDVLIFRTGAVPRHLGLALGGEKMLHTLKGSNSCVEDWTGGTWKPRLVGAVRYAGTVAFAARPLAMCGHGPRLEMPAGLSVAEMLVAAGMPDIDGLAVMVDRQLVARENWARVRPRAGRSIEVYAVPQGGKGGGKNVLKLALTISVIVASIYFPPAIGLTGITASLVSAGIVLGGTLAINALIPPPRPQIAAAAGDSEKVSHAITSSRNENRLWSPIPIPFGDVRFAPPLAARPYSEIVGDDQFIRQLFLIGYGECQVDEHRIGPTAIEEFDDVELQVRGGVAGEAPITLYPGTVLEQPLSVLLSFNNAVVRTSEVDADELAVDITFAQGLARINANGTRSATTVDIVVEYAPTGTNDWTIVNGTSPETKEDMDTVFRVGVAPLPATGTRAAANMDWGLAFPDPLPAEIATLRANTVNSPYAVKYSAYFTPDPAYAAGTSYVFGLDSSDAAELSIDGKVVVASYGTHSTDGGATPDFTAHTSGFIPLAAGNHTIEIRLDARSTAGALAVGWRAAGAPGDPLSVMPLAQRLVGSWNWQLVITTMATVWSNSAAVTEPIRRTLTWLVPKGQYDIRLRRITADATDSTLIDKAYWSTLRTIRAEDPVKVPLMARVGMRIKATEQLNGVVDEYNCRVRSVLPDWDSATQTWVRRPTSNPASIYREILQGRGNRRPLADRRLDLSAIQAWHEDCTARGFTFKGVIDFAGSLRERLGDVAAAGRASPSMRDGLFSVIRDVRQTVPAQLFTPRNSWGFKATRVFNRLPHAVRVRFLNADKDFEQDELVVLDDGYAYPDSHGVPVDARGNPAPPLPVASVFDSLELFGSTDRLQVWKHARYFLAVARLRPTIYELSASVDHLACQRGDLVHVAHDTLQQGVAWGRLVGRVMDPSQTTTQFKLDETVTMLPDTDYCMRVRMGDGTHWLRSVYREAAPTQYMRLPQPIGPDEVGPQVGDLAVVGPLNSTTLPMLVKAIEVDEELNGKLTLVDAAFEVLDADSNPPASLLAT